MIRVLVALSMLALVGFFIADRLISLGWDSNTWSGSDNMFYHLFATYDRWQLLGFVIVAALFVIILRQPSQSPMQLRWKRISIHWIAIAVFTVATAGTHLVFQNYPFAMDEFFADFQAAIFAKGHLWATIPKSLAPIAYAATPALANFQPETPAWTAAYLPVYAALRTPFFLLGCSWLVNPLLAGISVLALAAVIQKIWPNEADLPFVGVALLALSPQFLITSMTAYAMPAHICVNLLWLACFLRNDRLAFWLPPWIGVLALGLHQPNIHFFFVAPFILRLLWNRRWIRATYFVLVYAAGSAFWLKFIEWRTPISPHAAAAVSQFYNYFEVPSLPRLLDHLIGVTQILAWNGCALVFFSVLGVVAWKKSPPVIADLIAGMILALDCFLLFTENQGHGWGNRYFYSYLGSFALIAVAGFHHFQQHLTRMEKRALASVTLAGFVIQFSMQTWEAHTVVAPFARARDYFQSRLVETVVIDTNRIWYGQDLVRNQPGLGNRPQLLFLRRFKPDSIHFLDAKNSYEIVGYPEVKSLGLTPTIRMQLP